MRRTVLALMMWCGTALAEGWNLTYREGEEAFTPEEFILLQQKYPGRFRYYDPQTVFNAQVVRVKYRFEGQTTCADDDPRLVFQTEWQRICKRGPDPERPSECRQFGPPIPRTVDPCRMK